MTADFRGGKGLPFDVESVSINVPDCLQRLRQWVLWHAVERDGKTTKVPVDCWGNNAKVSDDTTWAGFQDVLQAYNPGRHAGIGFVFRRGGGVAGADLDGCRDPQTGQVGDWALPLIERLRGYWEVSPSGTGLKCFFPCAATFRGKNVKLPGVPAGHGKQPGIEVYCEGRYFAVTGVPYVR